MRRVSWKQKKARCLVSKTPGVILAMTYSRTTYRSTTIGSAAFHFRVRNGNGWYHCAGSPDFGNGALIWLKKAVIAVCLVTQIFHCIV